MEQRLRRSSHVLGYKSSDTMQTIRKLLNLCNSISIVFLYHNLLPHASKLLKQALKTDVLLFFQGSKEEKRWPRRALVYCNLSFLLLKLGDITSSLKFLYDSENLLAEIQSDEEYCDLKLLSSVVGFMAMSKIRRTDSMLEFLETATEEFNRIVRDECRSRYSRKARSNLYCIFTVAGEILQNPRALGPAKVVAREVLNKSNFEESEAIRFLWRAIEENEWGDGIEMISSDEFHEFLFLVVFFPFISSNTPIIEIEELLKEKYKYNERSMFSPGTSPGKQRLVETYSHLMKDALESFKSP